MINKDHNLSQILDQSRKIEDFGKIADILAKLGDPRRVQIFWILCHREECVSDLSSIVEMSSPAVSHHLKVLKECGIITARREGKEVYYSAADTELVHLLHHTTEEIMAVSCPENAIHTENEHCSCHHHGNECITEDGNYAALAVEIHEYLTQNLDRHITIESLAKEFAVNPTTIKTVFRDTFGNSLAAHTKAHRMEKAAELLKETNLSLAEIATAVGYQSQSKFTQAFRETFQMLPKDYRKSR